MTSKEFHESAQVFLGQVERELDQIQFQILPYWNIDHICYRVESLEQYRQMRNHFSTFATELIESPVNGRMITTYKLKEPIIWKHWQINLVELPAPKPNKKVKQGLEHIEIVCDIPFERLTQLFPESTLDKSGLQKNFNQELEIQLQNCAVKFHHLSLESVIHFEKNSKIFQTVQKLNLLENFRFFEPLIAGTFPLGIFTEKSDVDVLLYSEDLDLLYQKFDIFSHMKSFNKYELVINNERSILCRFEFEGVPFEFFGQRVRTVSQVAYKHFQIEERLLKLGSDLFRQQILHLKNQGIKTEPAFAEVLYLAGDPYLALLDLAHYSEKHLKEKLKKASY